MSEDARTDDVVDAPVIGADGDETGRVVTDVSAEAADGNPDDPEPGTAVGDDAQVESAPGPQADGDSEDDSVPEDHDDSADGGRGGPTVLRQRATFAPHGLAGHAYWWSIVVFHGIVFGTMIRGLVRAAENA